MATGNSRQRPFRVRKSYVLTDAEQREFLSRQCEALAREQPGIKTVRDRLLAIGGAETCLVGREEERDQMLTRGRAYSGRRAIRRTGERSRCHANVAGLHEQDPAGCRIATGYALSDDGIWRRHSWGLGRTSARSKPPHHASHTSASTSRPTRLTHSATCSGRRAVNARRRLWQM